MPKQTRKNNPSAKPKPKPKKQTEEEKKEKKRLKQENRKLVSGKDTLDYIELEIDKDIYNDEYKERMVMGGIKRDNIKKTTNDISCSIKWTIVTWSLSSELSSMGKPNCISQKHCVNFIVLIIRKELLSYVGNKLIDYISDATSDSRAVIILEGTSMHTVKINLLSSPNILSIKVFPNKGTTAVFLSGLTTYIAKAPFKIHNFTPIKGRAESDPHRIFRGMLSQIPNVGVKAIGSILNKYDTASHLLVAYKLCNSEEDSKLLLKDIKTSATQTVGAAASTSVYNVFVLGVFR